MKISQAGLDLIKSFEGCRLTAYNATGAEEFLTIGWGHYGADVTPGMVITQDQADAMLVDDMARYEAPVNALGLVLNQNQFDALVSFCYNCGAGNLRDLCLGRTITQIAANLPLYNKGTTKNGKEVLPGLVRRRAAELALFQTPVQEGSRKLMLSQTLQTMLGDALTELSKVGQTNNGNEPVLGYNWAQKAYAGELTVDEGVAIAIIAMARLQGAVVEPRG